MSFFAHIVLALKSGILAGFLLGHLDAVTRIAYLHFEWFEIYQALLAPALIVGLFYLLVSLVLHAAGRAFKLLPSPAALEQGYFISALLLFAVGLFWALLQLIFIGNIKMESTSYWLAPYLFSADLLLVTALAAVLRKKYQALRTFVSRPPWKDFFQSYGLIVGVFSLSLLAYDLYLLHTTPAHSPQVQAQKDRPNIVVMTLDTVRADHLSLYGYERKTSPYLDEFASKGVVFEKAISSAPWTLPSHSTLFTGKDVHRHGADLRFQLLAEEHKTLAEILLEHGYVTGGFGGGPYVKAAYGLGQGFQYYRDRLDYWEHHKHTDAYLSIGRLIAFFSLDFWQNTLQIDSLALAPEINSHVSQWLDKNQEHPFFLFINYFDAHDPYDLGEDIVERFHGSKIYYKDYLPSVSPFFADMELWHRPVRPDPHLKQALIDLYDAEIVFLDQWVEQLIEDFKRRGLYENTLFIIAADHGEEFFDHGGLFHLITLYQEVIHIPLFFVWEGQITPARREELVGLVDVFATILDLVEIPGQTHFDSVSLKPIIDGAAFDSWSRAPVLSERYTAYPEVDSTLKSLTDSRWKYIETEPQRKRTPTSLFDLQNDPGEKNNLKDKEVELTRKYREMLPDDASVEESAP